jgi:NAD-dependent SIR2 family protein deacetylase
MYYYYVTTTCEACNEPFYTELASDYPKEEGLPHFEECPCCGEIVDGEVQEID